MAYTLYIFIFVNSIFLFLVYSDKPYPSKTIYSKDYQDTIASLDRDLLRQIKKIEYLWDKPNKEKVFDFPWDINKKLYLTSSLYLKLLESKYNIYGYKDFFRARDIYRKAERLYFNGAEIETVIGLYQQYNDIFMKLLINKFPSTSKEDCYLTDVLYNYNVPEARCAEYYHLLDVKYKCNLIRFINGKTTILKSDDEYFIMYGILKDIDNCLPEEIAYNDLKSALKEKYGNRYIIYLITINKIFDIITINDISELKKYNSSANTDYEGLYLYADILRWASLRGYFSDNEDKWTESCMILHGLLQIKYKKSIFSA